MKSTETRKIDLAVFLPSLRGGGGEKVLLDLAGAFAELGRTVDLVLVETVGPYTDKVPEGVRLVSLGAGRVLSSLPALVRYLRVNRPIALLSTMGHANLVAIWASLASRVNTKVVIREGTTISASFSRKKFPIRSFLLRRLNRRFYPLADAVVAVSQGVSEDLEKSLGLPRPRIHLIYNPVLSQELLTRSLETVDHPWFQQAGLPIILSVGRLTAVKDFPTLLKAFGLVLEKRAARCVILGEGEERASLESLTRDLGISERVSLPGFVPNPFAYMARSSAYVLSSLCEGLPNALIQAATLGVPVVATDCPSGPKEVLQDGKLGKLVRTGDYRGMADAILGILDQPVTPPPRSAFQRFSTSKIVDDYNRLLFGGEGG